jgi:MtN3 and saliva related transmembrane protein
MASERSTPIPAHRFGPAQHMLEFMTLTKVDVIGWISSIVLLLTLGQQVRKQWVSRDSRGVSTWLFVGQTAASLGFSVYSLLLENWVFLTTNVLLLFNALLGQWVTVRNRRHSGALPGV